jgi:hypothetical protein
MVIYMYRENGNYVNTWKFVVCSYLQKRLAFYSNWYNNLLLCLNDEYSRNENIDMSKNTRQKNDKKNAKQNTWEERKSITYKKHVHT